MSYKGSVFRLVDFLRQVPGNYAKKNLASRRKTTAVALCAPSGAPLAYCTNLTLIAALEANLVRRTPDGRYLAENSLCPDP